jgi:hypothetical protein
LAISTFSAPSRTNNRQFAVSEHGRLGDARRPAGVLQERDVLRAELHRIELQAQPRRQRALESGRARHLPSGDLLAHVSDHDVHDHPAREAQKIADPGHQYVLQARPRQHLLQHMGEIFEDDDDFGARVLQLMLELARGVQRIDVHDRHARPQNAEQGDGILQHVGHHHGDPVAMRQSRLLLQPRREGPAQGVELRIAQRGAEAPVGDTIAVGRTGFLEHFPERSVLVRVDVAGHAGRIML